MMSKQMKHAMIRMILWTVVFVFFLIVFLTGDTLKAWGDNATKTLLMAALFLVGFSGDAVLRFMDRKRNNQAIKDERDDFIQNQAVSAGFIVTLLYVFLVTIGLYMKFEASGLVPVAWLWFLAYSLICVANLSVTAFSVYFYRKGRF